MDTKSKQTKRVFTKTTLSTPRGLRSVEITFSAGMCLLRCNFDSLEIPSFVDGVDDLLYIESITKPRRGEMLIRCKLTLHEGNDVVEDLEALFADTVTD